MTPSHDPFGRPAEGGQQAPARAPGRYPVLLATLAGGLAVIAVTMAFAVGWARDLPKTIAFAVAQAPFGERSLLHPDQARAGLERALDRVDGEERVTAVYLDDDRISVWTRRPDGYTAIVTTTITGEIERRETANRAEDRGVPVVELAAIDVTDGARAAQARWREIATRPSAPMVRLEIDHGRIRGWRITFSSEVPESERSVAVALDGSRRR